MRRLTGLKELGWTEGRNVHLDIRWGGDDTDRYRQYARELVGLLPDPRPKEFQRGRVTANEIGRQRREMARTAQGDLAERDAWEAQEVPTAARLNSRLAARLPAR